MCSKEFTQIGERVEFHQSIHRLLHTHTHTTQAASSLIRFKWILIKSSFSPRKKRFAPTLNYLSCIYDSDLVCTLHINFVAKRTLISNHHLHIFPSFFQIRWNRIYIFDCVQMTDNFPARRNIVYFFPFRICSFLRRKEIVMKRNCVLRNAHFKSYHFSWTTDETRNINLTRWWSQLTSVSIANDILWFIISLLIFAYIRLAFIHTDWNRSIW